MEHHTLTKCVRPHFPNMCALSLILSPCLVSGSLSTLAPALSLSLRSASHSPTVSAPRLTFSHWMCSDTISARYAYAARTDWQTYIINDRCNGPRASEMSFSSHTSTPPPLSWSARQSAQCVGGELEGAPSIAKASRTNLAFVSKICCRTSGFIGATVHSLQKPPLCNPIQVGDNSWAYIRTETTWISADRFGTACNWLWIDGTAIHK